MEDTKMTEVSSSASPFQIVEGLKIPAKFSADVFRSALQYKPRDDDVFVITYPKCGTTWSQYILILILRHGEPPEENGLLTHIAPFLDVSGAEGAEKMVRPGPLKAHFPFHMTPWSDKAKYVYVTRNPKDACVSYFHHYRNMPGHCFKGNFDEFFELFISGNIDYGDYFDHLLGWYEHRTDPNVLFMTYEEMKQDTKAAILKIASFIDDKLYAEPLRSHPEKLEKVIKYSSLKHMKEVLNKELDSMLDDKEKIRKSDVPEQIKKILSAGNTEGAEKRKCTNFVRKGIVGDWKNYFSEEQSKRMNAKFAEKTRNTEIAGWWKDYM